MAPATPKEVPSGVLGAVVELGGQIQGVIGAQNRVARAGTGGPFVGPDNGSSRAKGRNARRGAWITKGDGRDGGGRRT